MDSAVPPLNTNSPVAVVMNRKEILSEKIVALLFRHNVKARDLYDIYFLAKSGVDFEVSEKSRSSENLIEL